ncbi:MAG: 30S ribosomal protein S1 [Candidatus Margulisbacteria bacterium]|nr:30S ribosomal protein S1 [Candidatus Margulisiibacteriota bacterium]
MTEPTYTSTGFEKGKGEDEFFAVEDLIRQTLEESKALQKKEEPTPAPAEEQGGSKPQEKTVTQHPPATSRNLPQPPATSQYESTFREYQTGDIVKGKVLKVDQGGVLVDIKYKADGLIKADEQTNVKVGDIINVMIEKLEDKEGYVLLSKKRADQAILWKTAQEAYNKKSVLEAKVIEALQGGLVVDFNGMRGFVPASQVAKRPQENLAQFKDRIIPVKVIEVNPRQGKIVFSNRQAAGEHEKSQAGKIFDEIEVGQVRHGKVANLKSFGAFVDLGGVEGLIHLTELSWKRVKHPSEVLKTGQEIDVFVLGIDKENRKISLGLKELQPDPWANAADYYRAGQIIKVKVLRLANFGAFVELDHGLEGLIHISELSKNPIQTPDQAVKVGDIVEAKILRVMPEEQRIGLSIKQVQIAKEREELKQVAPPVEEQKVTIGDIIAQKEKERQEKEAEAAEIIEDVPAAGQEEAT